MQEVFRLSRAFNGALGHFFAIQNIYVNSNPGMLKTSTKFLAELKPESLISKTVLFQHTGTRIRKDVRDACNGFLFEKCTPFLLHFA